MFFKYFNFLVANIIAFLNLFSMNISDFALDIILPVGISFYTFQTLSYVIDVYRGTFPAERHLGYYALFVSFFPQLVAGPIERPNDLIPQLKAHHKLSWDDFVSGLRILVVGFFYKCVVADFLGVYVNTLFGADAEANALGVFIGGFLFFVQVYCDFAGYSEIAVGVARMMGIKLSRNFNRPYMPQSYSDFFRRWHITLTRWFTDYVYIPLGGNRKSKVRRVINVFVVFLLCGLWHGANWTYVLWGLYAAFFISIEAVLKKPLSKLYVRLKINTESNWYKVLRTISMYLLIVPASLIFRASDVSQIGRLFQTLFTDWGVGGEYFDTALGCLGIKSVTTIIQIVLCIVCTFCIWHFAEIERDGGKEPKSLYDNQSAIVSHRLVVIVYAIIAIALCWVALLASGDASAFQYFQF